MTGPALATVVIGTLLALVAAGLLIDTLGFPGASQGDPGPAIWPQILLALTIFLSALMVRVEVKRHRKSARDQTSGDDDAERPRTSRETLIVMALLAPYLLVMEYAGFYLATGLLIVAILYVVDMRRPLVMLAVASGMPAAVFVIFDIVVGLAFPEGSWFG